MDKIVQYYQTETKQVPFRKWFDNLRDKRAKVDIQNRIEQAVLGNLGNHKSVGQGVIELRIMKPGPGYRIYAGLRGNELIIILCGGDKSTQHKDIAKAIEYWNDYKRRAL